MDRRRVYTEFYFENIDCPNCAEKIESNLNKEERILSCAISFINKKIIVEHYSDDDVLELVLLVSRKTEKDVIIYKNKNKKMYLEHHHIHRYSDICKSSKCKTKRKIDYYLISYIFALVCFVVASCLQFLEQQFAIRMILFVFSYLVVSKKLILKAFNQIKHKDFFNENSLMVVASLGALIIGEGFEALMVVLLNTVGEYYKNKAIDKSKESISRLMDDEINEVTLLNNKKIDASLVSVGDIIILSSGEKLLLDGTLINDEALFDYKSLNGESLPKSIKKGEEVYSGAINLNQVVQIKVSKVYQDSTLSKVKRLIESSLNKKAKSQELISKFAKVYTPIVFFLALLVLLLNINTPFIGLEKAFSLLVISCPCALVISLPLCYFASIGRCSKEGILVKGGNYLEALTSIDKIVFDKTGTLTKGDFEITKIVSENEEEFLFYLYKCESFSTHPIASAIKKRITQEIVLSSSSTIEEVKGQGMILKEDGHLILCGNSRLLKNNNIEVSELEEEGTIIYVTKDGTILGYVVLEDCLKDEVIPLFSKLHKRKYQTFILSGDRESNVSKIASKLNVKNYYASLFPEEKSKIVSSLKGKRTLVYVGDGINDSISLALSDVGISFGQIGSSLAKECADVIIMNDDISKLIELIDISKFTKKIIIENLVMILLIKILAIVISYLGILSSYAMIFALFSDVGVCLLTILNTLRIIKFKEK